MTQPLVDVVGRNYGIRRLPPPPSLIAVHQPVWYVNAVTGSDTADGLTPATAIKTLAALTERWGRGALLEPTGGTMTVFLESSIPAADPLDLDVVLGEDVTLIFRGTDAVTSVFAGTLTAVTALNRAANQAITVTDALAPWAANITNRIRNTTVGPRFGSIAGIARDLGAGVARIARPWLTLVVGLNPVFLTAGGFNALDTYVIETIPQMTVANVNVQSLAGVSGVVQPAIDFWDIDVKADVPGVSFAPYNIGAATLLQFFTCKIPLTEIQGGTPSVYNSVFADGVFRTDGVAGAAIFGGFQLGPFGFFFAGGVGASMIYTFDFFVQTGLLQIVGVVLLDDVAVFDSPGNGIETNQVLPFLFSEALGLFGSGAVYGDQNAGVGFRMGSDALFIYSVIANVTITGLGGDFNCGAVGALVTPDPATDVNTAAVAQLWANIPIARPAGFGGTVRNPVNNARILPFF